MSRKTLKIISRLFVTLLALLFLWAAAPAALAAEESGSCGDGLSWTLSGGILTIEGSGAMTDFSEPGMAPWYEWREEISAVRLPEGLTSVGGLAFYEFRQLEIIAIPDSVAYIGDYAFAGCESARILTLGSGLVSIGDGAFSDCYSLPAIRLPGGLEEIGMKGFYRCESVSTVTIPASVTEIGVSAFAYCKSLISADVQASIGELPEYCFYGCERLASVSLPDELDGINDFSFSHCDNLTTVYYDGDASTVEEIMAVLNGSVTDFEENGSVTDETAPDTVTAGDFRDNGDGTITLENVIVAEGEDTSATTTIEYLYTDEAMVVDGVHVEITVESGAGWEEATAKLTETLNQVERGFSTDGVAPSTAVTIYVKNTDVVDQVLVDALSGRNVELMVITQNGSDWRLDCASLQQGDLESDLDFTYECSEASAEVVEELGGTTAYLLRFSGSVKINAEVMIKLLRLCAEQTACLYQRVNGKLQFLQAVVIDHDGYAHFYLGNVDSGTEYIVGINVPSIDASQAAIPKELQAEYGVTDNIQPVEYVITGRTSSWGMNVNQVTWIMVGALVVVVLAVGVTMFALNKRKLRMGYVPDLGDEE